MKIVNFDTNSKIFIIAEIGNNHEGSYNLAEEIIGRAAETGVDAVKFQTIIPNQLVSVKDAKRIEQLKKFQLSFEEFEKLARVAKNAGVFFLSTPFDLESAKFLNSLVLVFKIASGDNNFYPLLETVAKTGKPIMMSTGLADLRQIRNSQLFIQRIWQKQGVSQELAVLHCVSGYPVPTDQANLLAITTLKKELGCVVGYSDHTMGIEAAVAAAALGARIIEKHFTIDKHYSNFRDHQLSADSKEMKELVQKVRMTEALLGTGEKILQDVEKSVLMQARRSIAAKRDLNKGTVISKDDIVWVRPGSGLPPGQEGKVVGKRLRQLVKAGDLLIPEFVDHDYEK